MDKCSRYANESSLVNLSLENLPPEVLFKIFNKLDVPALCNIAMSSRTLLDACLSYINSCYGAKYVYNKWARSIVGAKQLGKLLKILTLSFTCEKKASYAFDTLSRSGCIWNENDRTWLSYCIRLGEFVHSFCEKCSEPELKAVHFKLQSIADINIKTQDVLQSKPGECFLKQRFIHQFYHFVYWHEMLPKMSAFWFSLIMKGLPYYLQAKFLMILLPMSVREDWPNAIAYIHTRHCGTCLRVLVEIMHILHPSLYFSGHDIASLFQELTKLPVPWSASNVSHFFLLLKRDIQDVILFKLLTVHRVCETSLFILNCGAALWSPHTIEGIEEFANFLILVFNLCQRHARSFVRHFARLSKYVLRPETSFSWPQIVATEVIMAVIDEKCQLLLVK